MIKETPQLDRPEIQRTQVTAKDVLTGKSKSTTVYGATPETIIKTLEKAIEQGNAEIDTPKSAAPAS